MKKKLLSLVLAGAMVASTSVSAFAQDKLIQDVDTAEPTTNITIMGQVLNESNEAPEGRFHVTVPTTTSFTVNKEKQLVSPNITITNGGTQKVDVYAHEFADSTATPDENISVLGENALQDKDRTNVSLNIHGNRGTAYLGSNSGNNKNGIYSDKDLSRNVQKNTGVLLSTIQSNDSDNLVLDGKVGQKSDATIGTAVSDNFTLVLKIKKNND